MLAWTLATPSAAQSLGDVARKEQARRKSAPSGKVYTNDNLPNVPPGPAAQPSTPASQQSASGQPAAPSTAKPDEKADAKAGDARKDEVKKDEGYWRERMSKEREALSRAESFAEALQSRINALSTDFVNRDDPAQRNVIAADRQKALAELDRVKKEIADHKKAIDGIQEEARRGGVPAGWVR
jgi:hypothetical protein